MKNQKLVCVIAMFLIFSFVFVSVSDAIFWLLAGAIRAGAIAIAAFVSTPFGQTIVRSVINHVIVGGLAYWYFDRGPGAPSAERYVEVGLTNTTAEIQVMKNEGKILSQNSPPEGWATSLGVTGWQPAGSGCDCDLWPNGQGPFPCWVERVVVGGGMASLKNKWSGEFVTFAASTSYPTFGYIGCTTYGGGQWQGYDLYLSTSEEKSTYGQSTIARDIAAAAIMADDGMKARIQDALGADMQRGGTLVSTPVANEPIMVVGVDGVSKEFPSGYSESDVSAYLGSTPSPAVGGSAGGMGTGGTGIGDIINSGLNGVKGSVDAINSKLGDNPGNVTAPIYNGDYTNPTENSISDRITSFIGSNPIISAIKGSSIQLNGGSCSVSGSSIFGKNLNLNFCWAEQYLSLFGNIMVIFSGLTAAFIIFKRGD